MHYASICLALAVIVAPFSLSGRAASQPKPSEIDAANRLFEVGKFAEANKLYARIADRNPKDYSAILQLGRIALLSNRLDEAQRWLEEVKVMLAESFYRRDDFQKAAASLSGVEVATNKLIISQYPTLNVAKLESFKNQTPYDVHGDGQTTRLKFLKAEPLPVVRVRVNGGDEVAFFIDTGGSEVALDTDFAQELGLPNFGEVQGTFSGGEHADVGQSRIESLTLGDWTIRNVPIATLALRQLSAGLGVKRIDGCIGTTLLYHFLATLDYPHGELVLRRKTPQSRQEFAVSSGIGVAVPFWIASDHFMVGWGQVDTIPPALLFVDSGLARAGVKLAEPVIKEAGIKLEEDKAYEGAGGGGKLKSCPTPCVAFPSETSRKTTSRVSTMGRSLGKTLLASTLPAWLATISSNPTRSPLTLRRCGSFSDKAISPKLAGHLASASSPSFTSLAEP